MNLTFIFLVSVAAMGTGLAALLFRYGRAPNTLPGSKTLAAEAPRIERYQFLRRLDSVSEVDHRWMRRQLMELRRDFLRFCNVCRLLAPYDAELGVLLLGQLVVFHRLWIPLWLGTYGWEFEQGMGNVTRLVNSAQRLRKYAQFGMEQLERGAFGRSTA